MNVKNDICIYFFGKIKLKTKKKSNKLEKNKALTHRAWKEEKKRLEREGERERMTTSYWMIDFIALNNDFKPSSIFILIDQLSFAIKFVQFIVSKCEFWVETTNSSELEKQK